jgi:hypothetical protein
MELNFLTCTSISQRFDLYQSMPAYFARPPRLALPQSQKSSEHSGVDFMPEWSYVVSTLEEPLSKRRSIHNSPIWCYGEGRLSD